MILIIIYGLYTEARTPGVGVPGLMAVVAAVLYLTPYYMYGLAAHWELVALILGVGLIAVEIFLIPGFGVTGLLGMLLCLMSLFLVMVQNDWFDFSFVPSKDLMGALMAVFSAIFIGGVIITVGLWRFPTSALSKRIALHETMDSEKGFVSVLEKNTSALVGKKGVVYSALRPSGRVFIEGKLYDAIAHSNQHIEEGSYGVGTFASRGQCGGRFGRRGKGLMSKVIGIIPSRYFSKRFEGKPLADVLGKPMIVRVYAQASLAKHLDRVVVATDDKRIEAVLKAHDIPVCDDQSAGRKWDGTMCGGVCEIRAKGGGFCVEYTGR